MRKAGAARSVSVLAGFAALNFAATLTILACSSTTAGVERTVQAETLGSSSQDRSESLPETAAPESLSGPQSNAEPSVAPVQSDEAIVPCPEEDGQCPSVRVVPTAESQLSDGARWVKGDDWTNNSTGQPGITLAQETIFPPYLWIANHSNNTVSRVSTRTGREEGRYWVGANPSRTAVDLEGNVWIGGRNDGRLTQILWDISKCPDRNEDGIVQTAGPNTLGPLNSPENPYADECVAYSEVPNPDQRSIRGIAAGPDRRVWFGFTSGGVQSIDPRTHEVGPHYPPVDVPIYRRDENGTYLPLVNSDRVPLKAHAGGVYGLVVDREGFLYTSSMSRNRLPRFSIFSKQWNAVFEDTGCQNYGIALDGRDRVWLGCTDAAGGVMMFDPATRQTHRFSIPSDAELPLPTSSPSVGVSYGAPGPGDGYAHGFGVTGLAVEPATGNVWASFFSKGISGRLILRQGELEKSSWSLIRINQGYDLRGVGFDHQGFSWTHGVASDRIWKIDPQTSRLARGFEQGVPVGNGPHYTYSDFTGSTGLSFTAPRGVWEFRVTTPQGATSATLRALRCEAFVPTNAQAEIRIRPLNAEGVPDGNWSPPRTQVGAAAYYSITPNQRETVIDLSEHNLRAPQYAVEVRVSTNERQRPVVNAVTLIWNAGE